MVSLPLHAGLQQFYREHGQSNGLFYMGHASVLAVFGGKKILFDPVILSKPYADSWAFFPAQVADPSVFDVDAVVVSHIHQDHYDLEYLKALDGKAKIVVVGGRPSFIEDLQHNGVKNLLIVEPETVTEILDGVRMYGVTHESNGIDSSAIVYNDAFCVYHGNDNYLQPESLKKFTRVGPGIDVACIPYAYIHWYPFLLEYGEGQAAEKQAEGDRLVNMYMDDCLNSIRILQPKLMIPFGANLLLDDGSAYSDINLAVKTPIDFVEYAAKTAPDVADAVKPMLAGDYCAPAGTGLSITIGQQFDGSSYRALAHAFLQERPAKQNDTTWRPIDKQAFMATLNDKVSRISERLENVIRVELNYLGERSCVEIDCLHHSARWVDEFSGDMPYHHFKLDPIASGCWLNGGRFEEVIGMRRFTLRREPNIYCKDVLRLISTVI
ncbi:MAG: MBL fold metallo-hydrolase [Rhizobacter sp.]|nr:MBL fold metallo-hydrolase [Rhizobacter sp.]